MTSIIALLKTFWCWIVIYWHRHFTYEIKSEDVYEEFFKHKHLFDFSNYPNDSKPFGLTNKKVIGKIKDKFEGKIVDEFVGLKSKKKKKKNIDGKEFNTTKGVNIERKFK